MRKSYEQTKIAFWHDFVPSFSILVCIKFNILFHPYRPYFSLWATMDFCRSYSLTSAYTIFVTNDSQIKFADETYRIINLQYLLKFL